MAADADGGEVAPPERTDQPLLSVHDLTVHFDTPRGVVEAVDHVSFDLRAGETLALVGETGCGKSVTARSLMQLVPSPPGRYPAGEVVLRPSDADDVDLLSASRAEMTRIRGDRIAMIFQDPGKALNPSLTVKRQVAEVFGEHRWRGLLEAAGADPDSSSRFVRRVARQRSGALAHGMLRLRDRGLARRLDEALEQAVMRSLTETGIPNPAPFCCQPVALRGVGVWVFRVGGAGRSVCFAGPGSG